MDHGARRSRSGHGPRLGRMYRLQQQRQRNAVQIFPLQLDIKYTVQVTGVRAQPQGRRGADDIDKRAAQLLHRWPCGRWRTALLARRHKSRVSRRRILTLLSHTD
eukprot:838402-Prymnesium_polylepis.1